MWEAAGHGIQNIQEIKKLLLAGWEPFAVSEGRLWLRRQVDAPEPSPPEVPVTEKKE